VLMYFRSQKKSAQDISINEPIDSDSEGNPLTLMDIVCIEDGEVEEAAQRSADAQAVRSLVSSVLDDRERQVICLRYGLDNGVPQAQREVAQTLGISRSYVSRIEKKAVEKLAQAMQKP